MWMFYCLFTYILFHIAVPFCLYNYPWNKHHWTYIYALVHFNCYEMEFKEKCFLATHIWFFNYFVQRIYFFIQRRNAFYYFWLVNYLIFLEVRLEAVSSWAGILCMPHKDYSMSTLSICKLFIIHDA